MPFSYKPSRYFDPREELDPTYQLALGTIFDDEDMEGEWKRIVKSSDFFTTPNEFAKQLNTIEKDDIEVWVASVGGSIQAMSQINELLQDAVNKGKNLLIKNVKMAYSAATLPFVQLKSRRGGGNVRTETAPLATFMIHNMSVNLKTPDHSMSDRDLDEFSDQIKEIASYTRRKNNEIANFYAVNTRLSREEIDGYMEREHIFTASEAVESGFVGKVGSTSMFDGKQEDEKDPYTDDDLYSLYSLCAMADMNLANKNEKAGEEGAAKTPGTEEGKGEEEKPKPTDKAGTAEEKAEGTQSQKEDKKDPPAKEKQQSDQGQEESAKAPDNPNPSQTQEATEMDITPELAAEVRAKLKMKDSEEVTDTHVLEAWKADQAHIRDIELRNKAEAKATLKTKIDEGLSKYFDAKIINAAEKADYTATIMAAPDPDAQLKSIQGLLDRAMPDPAEEIEEEKGKADPKPNEKLNGDPGKEKGAGKEGEETTLTPVEECSKAFYEVLERGKNSFQAYGRAYSHIRRKFPREVVEEFETQGKVILTTSENAKSKIEDIEKIERHNNAIAEDVILC